MTDDSTENTCNITSCKCYNELLAFTALITWFRHNMLVQQLDGSLKAGKFHHSVRNLTTPKWYNTFV